MKKKFATIALATAAVAALSIGGTLSYLQDEARVDNTMTFGNVSIVNHEYERAKNPDGTYKVIDVVSGDGVKVQSYELKEFTQDKPLFPATGEVTGWDQIPVRFEQIATNNNARGGVQPLDGLNNVQDKFVVVENNGKSDAYVRVLYAFEVGSYDTSNPNTMPFTINASNQWVWNIDIPVQIDGKNYLLFEAIYQGATDGSRHPNGVLKAGDFSYCSLAQAYLYNYITNEDLVAMDGNNNGKWDILVLSQAVQAEGFKDAKTALDTAFGVANQENVAKWFATQAVSPVQ